MDDYFYLCSNSICNFYIDTNFQASGNCEPLFSLGDGASCGNFGNFVCGQTSECGNLNFLNTGTCGPRRANITCDTVSTPCQDLGSVCACTTNTSGLCVDDPCENGNFAAFYSCILSRNCSLSRATSALTPGTCASPCGLNMASYICCQAGLPGGYAPPEFQCGGVGTTGSAATGNAATGNVATGSVTGSATGAATGSATGGGATGGATGSASTGGNGSTDGGEQSNSANSVQIFAIFALLFVVLLF
jgi:hypothetical protein